MSEKTLHLGTGISVLKGLDPLWLSGNYSGFFPANKEALKTTPVTQPETTGEWSEVQVSLHENADDLLAHIFTVSVLNPLASGPEAVFSAGELLLHDADRTAALAHLKDTFGIDFAIAGRHYALVKMIRKDGDTVYHPLAANGIVQYPDPVKPDESLGVQKNFHDAQHQLPFCNDTNNRYSPNALTAEAAAVYISFFDNYGTHFISGIQSGDCIFQVFAYEESAFRAAQKGLAQLVQKERQYQFNYYTTPKKDNNNGFAVEIGKLVSLSGDPAFKKSVADKEWHDNIWAQTNSIFTLYNSDAGFSVQDMDERFTAPAVLHTYITSLHIFGRQDKTPVWNRLFAGAITAKYPSRTQPKLTQYLTADLGKLFDNAQGIVSAIATPTINLYQPRIILNDLKFAAAEILNNFTITTNLLSATQYADSRFNASDVLIAAQAVNGETKDTALHLSFPNYKKSDQLMYCNRFYGLMHITTGNSAYTILDGIQLQTDGTDANGKSKLKVEKDIRTTPAVTSLSRLRNSISFSYAFLQSSLYMSGISTMNGVEAYVRDGMSWIGKLIPKDTTDTDLQDMRFIAMDTAITAHPEQHGIFVPILPGAEYNEEMQANLKVGEEIKRLYSDIQEKIDRRRIEELIATTAETINENIIASGRALGKLIDSVQQQQASMAKYHKAAYDSLMDHYKDSIVQADKLQALTDQQQDDVNSAIEYYKEKVQEWQQKKMISAAIDIISGVFTAATGNTDKAKEAGAAVADMANTIEKIKTVLKVLAALKEGYGIGKDAQRDIHNGFLAMEEAEKAGKLQVSEREWDEMEVNLRTVLAAGPDEGDAGIAKERLLGAYKKLVIRGKAMFQARSATMRIAREIANTTKLQQIAQEQAGYLSQVKTDFKSLDDKTQNKDIRINREKADIAGLTGYLDFLQNRVFTTIASLYTLQDQAFRYEYNMAGTPIRDFSLLGIYDALAQQAGNLRVAKTEAARRQKTPVEGLEIVIEDIPASAVTNGNVFRFNIGLENKALLPYVDVRVTSLDVLCDTDVLKPDGGEYHLYVNCLADTMMDRNMKREPVVFRSLSRDKTYHYKSNGGEKDKPTNNDGTTWSKGKNPPTPFTTWEISFPDTGTNKEISFADTLLNFRFRFDLEVHIKDLKPHLLRGMALGDTQIPIAINLVKEMQGRSVTNDWDVVYNMSLSQINNSLKKQYEAIKNNPAYTNKIHQETKVKRRNRLDLTMYDLEYGYPTLEFPENNTENVRLVCDITGSIAFGEEKDGVKDYDAPEKIEPQKLIATIPISMIEGLVKAKDGNSKVLSVAIRMADGTFKTDKMDLPEQRADINQAMKDYFAAKEIKYVINTLDLSKISTLNDLCPSNFRFKTLITKGGQKILQLFILTGGRTVTQSMQTYLTDLHEPLPSDADSSLIISNRILFNSILPGSIRGGWTIGGVTPAEAKKPWSSKFTGGNITGTFDTSPLTHRYAESFGSGIDATWIQVEAKVYLHENESNNISWPVTDMTIKPEGGLMKLYLDKKLSIDFYVKEKKTFSDYPNDTPRYSGYKSSSNVNLKVDGSLPLKVSGKGKDQVIRIENTQEIKIDGQMEGGGFCNRDTLASILNRTIRDQVKKEIGEKMSIPFDGVSVFALENLLFPTGDVMEFRHVFTPADLVIFGNFV